MQIYEKELNDGIFTLSDKIVAECKIVEDIDSSEIDEEHLKQTIARYAPSNPDQPDLHYLNCVLASAGWNKNDDVFDLGEFWQARRSPEDKPFNYMHNELDIIGHMTSTIAVDEAGNKISLDTELSELPKRIDLVTSAVIYKYWSDLEQLERVKELIEEIQSGEWAVSMECLFKSFDYAIINPHGEEKVVARNENSAFLTKHLRAYGGTGEYQGHKIGRLLRNICFSAIGLVKRPANPRSLILNNSNSLGEILEMPDTLNKTAAGEDLENKIVALETELATANQKLVDVEKNQTDVTKALETSLEETKKTLVTITSERDVAVASADDLKKQLKTMEEKVRCMERRSVLASMRLDSDTIEDMLEKFKEMDDSAFSTAVSLAKMMKPVVAEQTTESVETPVETETEVEASEVEEVEEVNLSSAGETVDEVQKVQASVANWFAKSVLKTTKNLK
jgi:hypothetical protein